jgi:hypothetical protein
MRTARIESMTAAPAISHIAASPVSLDALPQPTMTTTAGFCRHEFEALTGPAFETRRQRGHVDAGCCAPRACRRPAEFAAASCCRLCAAACSRRKDSTISLGLLSVGIS